MRYTPHSTTVRTAIQHLPPPSRSTSLIHLTTLTAQPTLIRTPVTRTMASFNTATVFVDNRTEVLLGYNPFMETSCSPEKWWLIPYADDCTCGVKPFFPLEGKTVRTSTDVISEVLFEDRDFRLATILIRKRFLHLRGMFIVYGRYDGVWALACSGNTALLLPDVLVCVDQYDEVVERLLLNDPSHPVIKYFDGWQGTNTKEQ